MAIKFLEDRLTEEQVNKIREMRDTEDRMNPGRPRHSISAIADAVGVSPGRVAAVAKNHTYHDPDYKPRRWGVTSRNGIPKSKRKVFPQRVKLKELSLKEAGVLRKLKMEEAQKLNQMGYNGDEVKEKIREMDWNEELRIYFEAEG